MKRPSPFIIALGILILGSLFHWGLSGGIPTLGASDDLFILSPRFAAEPLERLRYAYGQMSGRLGEELSAIFWSRLNNFTGLKPLQYPWWLIKSASLMLLGVAGVLIHRALLTMSEGETKRASGLGGTLLLLLWWMHPSVAQTIDEFAIMILAYSLGPLLMSAMFTHWTRESTLCGARPGSITITAFLSALCGIGITVHEQVFLSVASISFFASLEAWLRGPGDAWSKLKFAIRLKWPLLLSSLVALVIFLASPGQYQRRSVAVPRKFDLSAVLEQSGNLLLSLFGSGPFPRRVIFLSLALAVIGILTLVIYTWKKGLNARSRFKPLYWACACLLTGIGTNATLLFASYYPERARIIPLLWLTLFLILLADEAIRALRCGQARKLVIVLLVALTGYLSSRNFGSAAEAWSRRAAIDATRYSTYHELTRSAPTPNSVFRVVDCPSNFDASSGFGSYLTWQFPELSSPPAFSFDGIDDSLLSPAAKRSPNGHCRLLMPSLGYGARAGLPSEPFIMLVHSDPDSKKGSIRILFKTSGENCDGYVRYPPDIMGDASMLETRNFRLRNQSSSSTPLNQFNPQSKSA